MKEKGICGKCKIFPVRNKTSSYCKKCHCEYQRNYYKNKLGYKEKRKEQLATRAKETRALVIEAKNKPCMDCGGRFPYYVMDLDHLRDKKFNLSDVSRHAHSIVKVKKEIEKCEVVCSNCHRVRTFTRIGSSANGRP